MKFTKMQGAGNDYIYVNAFTDRPLDPAAASIRLSDRHFGIGSDGLILIGPSERADFTMEIYNADGSQAKMCGNGIRCVGKYVYDHGLTDKTCITVETLGGIKTLNLIVENGKVKRVRVDMEKPVLDAALIPAVFTSERVINEEMEAAGMQWNVTAVSMGNPHCVVRVQDTDALDLEKIGPEFEHSPHFPDRVNTEFIQVIDKSRIKMRVWERGSGETMACGTGACASAVAAALNGWCSRHVTVELRGGELEIEWNEENDTVYMTGPAETVFEGEVGLGE